MKARSKDQLILVSYVVVVLSFIFVVKFHERGYNDAGILDGIFIPTLIFIFLSLIAETFISDNRLIVVICAFFVGVLCLIPSLKYQLFYGCFDSVEHYGVVKNLVSSGNIPTTGFYAPYYSDVARMLVPKFVCRVYLVLPVPKLVRCVACAYGFASLLTHSPAEFFPTCPDSAANLRSMVPEEAELFNMHFQIFNMQFWHFQHGIKPGYKAVYKG